MFVLKHREPDAIPTYNAGTLLSLVSLYVQQHQTLTHSKTLPSLQFYFRSKNQHCRNAPIQLSIAVVLTNNVKGQRKLDFCIGLDLCVCAIDCDKMQPFGKGLSPTIDHLEAQLTNKGLLYHSNSHPTLNPYSYDNCMLLCKFSRKKKS